MAHSPATTVAASRTANIVDIVFLAISWAIVLVRIYIRAFLIRNFGWDDKTMIITQIFFTLYCATQLVVETNGGGTHVTNYEQEVYLLKWTLGNEVAYVVTMVSLKISLGLFFTRIFVHRTQVLLIRITVAVACLFGLLSTMYTIFRCGNPKYYIANNNAGKCSSSEVTKALSYCPSVVFALTDWIFAGVAFSVIWRSSMERRAKCTVGLILSLGVVGSICSIIRFIYFPGLLSTTDFYYASVNAGMWSTIELGAGIIACSLATYRPLLRSLYEKAKLSIGQGYSDKSSKSSKSKAYPNKSQSSKSSVIPYQPGLSQNSDFRGFNATAAVPWDEPRDLESELDDYPKRIQRLSRMMQSDKIFPATANIERPDKILEERQEPSGNRELLDDPWTVHMKSGGLILPPTPEHLQDERSSITHSESDRSDIQLRSLPRQGTVSEPTYKGAQRHSG